MKDEGGTRDIINGIGIGFFISIFLSMYLDAFANILLPIWMIYGILAPLMSAISIAILIFSDKEKRELYTVKYWEEKKRQEKERNIW